MKPTLFAAPLRLGAGLALLLPALSVGAAGPAQMPDSAPLPSEPVVRHRVIEDDGARIEELRVRGETQRLTVTTRGPLKSTYDIVPSKNGSSGGNVGRPVWSVRAF